MNFEDALIEFEKAVGKLKRAYEEKYGENSSYLEIAISDGNYMTITPTNDTGEYIHCVRRWLDTELNE